MSSHSIKQTLVAGTLVIVLGLPGMAQGRRGGGNIDIPPALLPAVKKAMKARKQLLQAKIAVLKAAQHLQSEVEKLEASSKTSSGKGRVGKAPSMNPTDSKTNRKTQKSIKPTGRIEGGTEITYVSEYGNRSGSVHQKVGKRVLGLLLTDLGHVTEGTVSQTGTIPNAKNAKAITAAANKTSLAPFKGKLNEVLSEEIKKVQLQLNTPVIQGNKIQMCNMNWE